MYESKLNMSGGNGRIGCVGCGFSCSMDCSGACQTACYALCNLSCAVACRSQVGANAIDDEK